MRFQFVFIYLIYLQAFINFICYETIYCQEFLKYKQKIKTAIRRILLKLCTYNSFNILHSFRIQLLPIIKFEY